MNRRLLRLARLLMVIVIFTCNPVYGDNIQENEEMDILSRLLGEEIDESRILSEYNDDLNVIGVENADGTNSIYIFDRDIKLQDEEGEIYYSTNVANSSANVNNSAVTSVSVFSNYPSTNYNSTVLNIIGTDDYFGVCRTYIKFDLSSISHIDYDDILSASYTTEITNTSCSDQSVAEVYFVKNSWNASTITWENMPDYYGTEKICIQNMNIPTELEEPDENLRYLKRFYITSAVQAWAQGLSNNGIVILAKDDEGSTRFSSNLHTTDPSYLKITYFVDEAKNEASGVISNKYYYLLNKNSKLVLSANSLIAGDDVIQKGLESTALQTWKLCYLNNGYYAIKCANSSACLEVKDNVTTANNPIVVGSYTGSNSQQWKIIRNWDGSYQIISRLSGKALSVLSSSTNEDAFIVQYPHSINFYKQDDWTLIPAEKGTVTLYGFSEAAMGGVEGYTDYETMTEVNKIKSLFTSESYTTNVYEDSTSSSGYNTIQSSDVWHFAGHGNTSGVIFNNASNSKTSLYYYGTNSYVGNNLFNLANTGAKKLQMCTFAACLGGVDNGDYNLCGGLYQKGAHFVAGYTNSVTGTYSDQWYWYFYLSMCSGKDILYSINFADTMIYNIHSDERFCGECIPKHVLGDNSIILEYNECPTHIQSDVDLQVLELNPVSSIDIKTSDFSNSTNKSIYVDEKLVVLDYLAQSPEQYYDVYVDEYGSLYEFYANTNILVAYSPNYDCSKLGDTVVDSEKAIELSKTFLERLNYDIEDFIVKTSNDYSKNFVIEYVYYENDQATDEKIVLNIKSDDSNNLQVVFFKADNYGDYSIREGL